MVRRAVLRVALLRPVDGSNRSIERASDGWKTAAAKVLPSREKATTPGVWPELSAQVSPLRPDATSHGVIPSRPAVSKVRASGEKPSGEASMRFLSSVRAGQESVHHRSASPTPTRRGAIASTTAAARLRARRARHRRRVAEIMRAASAGGRGRSCAYLTVVGPSGEGLGAGKGRAGGGGDDSIKDGFKTLEGRAFTP